MQAPKNSNRFLKLQEDTERMEGSLQGGDTSSAGTPLERHVVSATCRPCTPSASTKHTQLFYFVTHSASIKRGQKAIPELLAPDHEEAPQGYLVTNKVC